MSKAQDAIARARKTATEAKADAAETVSGMATSYLIGSMKATGTLAQIPSVMGLPKTVVLAAVAKAIAYNSTGKMKQIANGAGNAAAHIAVFEFSSGQSVSGVDGAIHDRGARLNAAASRLGSGGASAEAELASLEGEVGIKKAHARA